MKWIVPLLREETGEFERVASTFNIELPTLISRFQKGTIENLDRKTWSLLENTDSWDTVTLEQVFEAAAQTKRNAQIIIDAFQQNKVMQTPMILSLPDNKNHLISGNTRLMICRAMSIYPKIFKI